MEFSKKTWKPRIVQYTGRRKFVATENENEYDVTRAEGEITQIGDGFAANNMNDLEARIESAVNGLNTNLTTLENNAIKVAELSAPQSTVAANGAVSISCAVSTSRVVNAVWYAGGGSSGMVYVSFASGNLHFRNITGASYTPTSTHKIFVFYY